jgi:hypothetical protein
MNKTELINALNTQERIENAIWIIINERNKDKGRFNAPCGSKWHIDYITLREDENIISIAFQCDSIDACAGDVIVLDELLEVVGDE